MVQVLVNIQMTQASHLQALKVCILHDMFLHLTTQETSVHVRQVGTSDLVPIMSLVNVHAVPDLEADQDIQSS